MKIIVIDDDKDVRTELDNAFSEDTEYEVILFEDYQSFIDSYKNGGLNDFCKKIEKDLIFIMEIMFPTKEGEIECWNNLGFVIADDIRSGKFTSVIDKNTPIFFHTKRTDESTILKVEKISNSLYSYKGSFFEDILYSIEKLLHPENLTEVSDELKTF